MRHHVPTCLCESCERTGGGDFAVRAYIQGAREADSHLSKQITELLPSLVVEQPSQEAA